MRCGCAANRRQPPRLPQPASPRVVETAMADTLLCVRMSAAQRARLAAAAAAAGKPLSRWIREQALGAILTELPPPAPVLVSREGEEPRRRSRTLFTWVTEQQYEAVCERSLACELTVSAFIREVLLGGQPAPRRPLLRSAIVAVDRAANSLRRVAQLSESGTPLAPDLRQAVATLRQEIHALRDALLTADAAAAPPPRT